MMVRKCCLLIGLVMIATPLALAINDIFADIPTLFVMSAIGSAFVVISIIWNEL
jgi:hypothetical protein